MLILFASHNFFFRNSVDLWSEPSQVKQSKPPRPRWTTRSGSPGLSLVLRAMFLTEVELRLLQTTWFWPAVLKIVRAAWIPSVRLLFRFNSRKLALNACCSSQVEHHYGG